MDKQEFENLVQNPVMAEDFEIIQTVYTYHPTISNTKGKQEIANIYKLRAGMRIIKDMLPTAEKVKDLWRQRSEIEGEINELRAKLALISIQMGELES